MSTDMALVQAYLANVQMALQNRDVSHAQTLLEIVQHLLNDNTPTPIRPPMPMCVGIGLDAGVKRKDKPNEDFAFAATGRNSQTQQSYGLFIVADGMGGHANGRLASRLAVETIVSDLIPYLQHKHVQARYLGDRLSDAVVSANAVINARNQEADDPQDRMGTTVTAAVIFGLHAFIVNVGDSRTYLYRPDVGLRAVTQDHSYVADLVACGERPPEAIYTDPDRHAISRCLGITSTVEVDLFYEQLQHGDLLLFCSDGLWEMARDEKIEQILATQLTVPDMVMHLINLAIQEGGQDNIGLVIAQYTTQMQTIQVKVSLPEEERS